MNQTENFGPRSTADRVLAGIDLTGKHMLVTGCDSGIGFETMSALAANGTHVIAAARTLEEATQACRQAGYPCTPVACDLGDLNSVAAAAEAVRQLRLPLDAIVANADSASLQGMSPPDGAQPHVVASHVGHFALVQELAGTLREATGRIVIAARRVAASQLGLYARELSRRMHARGIAVNAVDPGEVRGTPLQQNASLVRRLRRLAALPFLRTPAQGAATIALLAANPSVTGMTGQFWQDCAVSRDATSQDDGAAAIQLWTGCEALIAAHRTARTQGVARAA
jgi:WW domain-containing oxidoreductase